MGYLFFLNCFFLAMYFFCFFESSKFLSLWFALELLTLGVMPYFFDFKHGTSSSVFHYVVVSSISSVFLVLGVMLFPFQNLLMVCGVFMKLGVFPFMGWAYEVVSGSSWTVVWFFSGVLKVSFFLLLYLSGLSDWLILAFCFFSSLGFLVLTVKMWYVSGSWKLLWCHMMLSGSTTLAVSCFYSGVSYLLLLYAVYLLWMSLSLLYISYMNQRGFMMSGFVCFFYFFLLVSFPFSLSLFYKFVSVLVLLNVPFFVLLSWCLYAISEQLYLVYYVVVRKKVRGNFSLFSFV